MKTKIFGVIAMLALAIFASSMVLAEDNETLVISSNPTSVTEVSSSEIFWKEVGLWFTFKQERKMEKEMELAQLRLKQAEFATQNNMTVMAERSLASYEKLVSRANKRAQLIEMKSSVEASVVKLAVMDQAILAHKEIIDRISLKLENANLTDEQREDLEKRLAKAENVTAHLEEVQTNKEEKVRMRLMAENNLTEDEANEQIDDAKDKASEIVEGGREAWKSFKDEAKANNKTVREFAKQKVQELKEESEQEDNSS